MKSKTDLPGDIANEDDEVLQSDLGAALEIASVLNRHCQTAKEVEQLLNMASVLLGKRFHLSSTLSRSTS